MAVTAEKDGLLAYELAQLQESISAASQSETLQDASELTISGGVVTSTGSYHLVDTEDDAASDDLYTIGGAATGKLLVIRMVSFGRTVVCKDGGGNLYLAGDFSLTSQYDRLMLIGHGTDWIEISRSDNT